MLIAEIEAEAVLGNVIAAIAPALRPGAMIAVPPLSAILLPCTMSLPGTLLGPSPLLLPRDCLLLRTLRLLLLLGLPGTLCLLLLRLLLLGLLDALLLWLLLLDLLSALRLLLQSLLASLLRLLLPSLLCLAVAHPAALRACSVFPSAGRAARMQGRSFRVCASVSGLFPAC